MRHIQDMRPGQRIGARPAKGRFSQARSGIYHGWRRVLYSWPAVIVLLLLVLWMGTGVWGVYTRWNVARAERQVVEARLDEQRAKQASLQARIDKLSTDRGQEEELRRNFPVAKPGEEVIILVGTSTDSR